MLFHEPSGSNPEEPELTVDFDLTNTAGGREVAQIYIQDLESSLAPGAERFCEQRPIQFCKKDQCKPN